MAKYHYLHNLKRFYQRNSHTVIVASVIVVGIAIAVTSNHLSIQNSYVIGSASSLLPEVSPSLVGKLSQDKSTGAFSFNNGQSMPSAETINTGAPLISASANADPSKGMTVTDPVTQAAFGLTPKFDLRDGRQDGGRIVYPLENGSGWAVYTMQATGVKEDILLKHSSEDKQSFEYTLNLTDGLVSRLEADGSIGIYGDALLSGNVTTNSEADAELLQKARANAEKNTFLFNIPKPVIIESGKKESKTTARYALEGTKLTVIAEGLKDATYPLSIDPSIYVVTAQQFMNGNNETNINFNVANKLIEKSPTTGARFDIWDTTTSLPTSVWGASTAVAGGYIYSIGGSSLTGQIYTAQGTDTYVVPTGVTSLTIKMWGAGGGGGGGGNSQPGGAGGGGGYTQSTITVTPGETLNVYVGGGGGGGNINTSGSDAGAGGGGGGVTSIYRSGTALAIASGGGGGGGGRDAVSGGAGGAGGGTTGVAGTSKATNNGGGGGGGTPSAGGAAGAAITGANAGTAGTSLTGGLGGDGRNGAGADGSGGIGGLLLGGAGGISNISTTRAGGGGGGSGYFGGGGGSATTSTGTAAGGGGGGGSSYTIAGSTGVTNTAGSGTAPGNSGDTSRSGAGDGGAAGAALGNGTAGDSGIAIVSYGSAAAVNQTVSWAKFNTTTGAIDSANPGNGACSGWCTSSLYNLPAARTNFSVVAYNGFLYVMGGIDGSGTTQNTVYIAKIGANGEPQLWHPTDTNKNNWTYWYTDTNLSSIRSDGAAVAYNNRMYLIGGRSTSGTPVSTVQVADITPTGTLGTWTSSTSLSTASYGHGAQVYNDRLYIIGGSATVGGSLSGAVSYNKINSDGTLNSWISTTALGSGRITNGGNFTTVWGGYIYLSGGCTAVNASGYCTTVAGDTQVASINADGSIDKWNTVGGVTSQRTGASLVSWRNNIYHIGGCSAQNTTTGDCNTGMLNSIFYGTVNPDGDASTVNQSVASGTAPCSGASPYSCNHPAAAVGNVLNATAILNGYLYIMGGCTNNACTTVSAGVVYAAIGSDGSLTKPAVCTGGSYVDSYCVSPNSLPAALGAAGVTTFNGRIYVVGGFPQAGGNSFIYYTTTNYDGSVGAWSSADLTTIGATDVSYPYAYSRANPAAASSVPGNLYIFGGCTNVTVVSCGNYTQNVYKCNLSTSGVPSGCSASGQLQIGTPSGATGAGLGAHAGTVYANYIYLIGGLAPGIDDLKTTRYAKFDNNNNVVAVTGSAWVESANQTIYGRRRGAAFGYNGYIYIVGGYDGSDGSVLADIEFAKINVSNGSIGAFTESAVTINQRWGLSVPVSNSFAYVIGGCTVGAAPGSCTTRTNTVQTFQLYNNDSGAPASYKNPPVTSSCTATGNAKFDRYDGIAGTAVANLYAAGAYPNSPSSTTTITGADLSGPANAADNYGGRLSALVCAPQTGNYRFWLASDDNGELRVSTNDSIANVSVVASVSDWTNVNEWTKFGAQQSADVYLVAGQQYYIEANYKEGGGGDHVEIGWTLPNATVERPIPNTRYSLPTELTPYSAFTVSPDRIGASATVLNGYIYVAGGCTDITCTTITNDVQVAALNASDGTTGSWSSAGSLPDTRAYGKLLSAGGSLYYAGGISNTCGTQTGNAKFDRYDGIAGTAVANLYAAGAYPNSPSSTTTTAGADLGTPYGVADNFGGRLSALVCAPQTGNYRFWLASDDGGELRVSTTDSIANIVAVASVSGFTNVNEWTKYGTQQSADVSLVAGRQYYVEANYKEGNGGDFAQIGWTLPNATVERAIPNTRYSLPTEINKHQSTVFYSAQGSGGSLGSWSTASNGLPSGRSNFGAAVWNNRLYVVGGDSNTGVSNTVYVSPQLNSGGNITSSWSTSTALSVARSGATAVAYANNLYVLGGYDGTNYLSDTQYSQLSSSTGLAGAWTYSTSLPEPITQADGFAANGYIYLIGGRSGATSCKPSTLVAPISANTTIASGNNPTGVGAWFETNARYSGDRYGASAVYNDGKAYVIGGGCASMVNTNDRVYYTSLLSQPQIAKYSIMIDTDSDVFPTSWLLNGLDNSIGARWQLKYRSMANTTTSCTSPAMTTWGAETVFGNVTLGLPGAYTPKNAAGTNINCARFYYFNVGVDSSQAFGYPDDVTRGPTITDLTLQFTADPSKRLMHGRTFTGGLQQPVDTPYYAF